MDSHVLENFKKSLNHQEPDEVPVVIWASAPPLPNIMGVNSQQFYHNVQLKLHTQLAFQKEFPEIIMFPGLFPDFGVAGEASAFGCDILWQENNAPFANRIFTSIEQIKHLKIPNPHKDGLLPKVLDECRYMWKHIDKSYIEDYGYLDGVAFSMGPCEIAGLLVGYDVYFMSMALNKRLLHNLMNITTEFAIIWLKAQEKVNGTLKRLLIAEHLPSQVSLEHSTEFCFPYIKQVYDAFPDACKIYHNEGNCLRFLPKIVDFGADIFHFGDDVEKVKREIGSKITLMGNLSPTGTFLKGTPEQVQAESLSLLKKAHGGGGFLLSTAGGLAPHTPKENIKAMIKSVKDFSNEKKNENIYLEFN